VPLAHALVWTGAQPFKHQPSVAFMSQCHTCLLPIVSPVLQVVGDPQHFTTSVTFLFNWLFVTWQLGVLSSVRLAAVGREFVHLFVLLELSLVV